MNKELYQKKIEEAHIDLKNASKELDLADVEIATILAESMLFQNPGIRTYLSGLTILNFLSKVSEDILKGSI